MQTKFHLTSVDELPPEALTFLHEAYKASPLQDQQFWEILRMGEVYVIRSGGIVGAMCLEYAPGVVNIALLGGKDIAAWKDDFLTWGEAFLKEHQIKQVLVLGRQGWGRMFKNLKVIGTLYSA